MAYCENCGAVRGAGAKFCRTCGASAALVPDLKPAREAQRPSRAGRVIKPDKLDKIVGLAVLVVATAAITLYFVLAWVIPFTEGFIDGLLGS